MAIENWSDRIVIAHLGPDPSFTDDLQTIGEMAGQRAFDVVLDFGGVRFLNSSHLAKLLKLRKTMIATGNRLVMCCVDTQVWSVFLVTGLDKIFEFSDAVPLALAGLQLSQQSDPASPA
jgi:anti-anti-sigma factor